MSETLIVIDGNSLMHRAFYALPPMKNTKGQNTGAIYGFINMLLKVIDTYAPTHIAVAFDKKGKTFRHEFYEEYKAGRKATPPELVEQLATIHDVLQGLSIKIIELDGFEADDILGTLSKRADEENMRSYLVTGDKDALQLISDNTHVLFTKKGVTETVDFDKQTLKETYGLDPSQIISLKALMGDSSDNIPGVPGIGEKTALKLLHTYATVKDVYENIEQLPANKMREKLIQNQDKAILSAKLATIDREIPLALSLDDCAFLGLDDRQVSEVLGNLEFFSILKRRGISETAETKEIETIEIKTVAELEQLISKITGRIAIYAEEETLYLATSDSSEYKIQTAQSLFGEYMAYDEAIKALKPLMESDIEKIIYHEKAFRHILAEFDIDIRNVIFDVMIAEYVLNPTKRSYSFDKIKHGDYAGNACALFSIMESQKQQISAHGLEKIFYEIEMPLTRVLYDMERQGFRVDTEELTQLGNQYAKAIKELTEEIYTLCGHSFNIASPKQLGTVLFEELGLPTMKKTKTGYSTDIAVLEKLQDKHPVISKIIEFRQLSKLKSTYIDGLTKIIDKRTNKIHTTFQQTATATGRISSIEPNLQNIPVKTETGREIRRAFIPSDEGHTIVSADYSQIELRVLAHMSQDAHMIDAFLHEEDIHTRTASEVFHVPIEEVTSEMRSSAKAVNFGIVYGISDFGLARNLNIPVYRAAQYIENYLIEFSGVRNYMKTIVETAKKDGFVRTMWGRIRYIDELQSSNYNTRSFGERAAMNTPIQGTAADIIKFAMISVWKALTEKQLKSKLILQVHDELIIDAVDDEIEDVINILETCMSHACRLVVPLVVDVKCGSNWAEAK